MGDTHWETDVSRDRATLFKESVARMLERHGKLLARMAAIYEDDRRERRAENSSGAHGIRPLI